MNCINERNEYVCCRTFIFNWSKSNLSSFFRRLSLILYYSRSKDYFQSMLTSNENDHYVNGFIFTLQPRGTLPDLSRRRIVAPTSRHVVVEMDMCHKRRANRPTSPCSDHIPAAVFVEKARGNKLRRFSYKVSWLYSIEMVKGRLEASQISFEISEQRQNIEY